MAKKRNRSQGWKHAKTSGHRNEYAVRDYLLGSQEAASDLHKRLFGYPAKLSSISLGGIHETSVPSVLGGKTKTKIDLLVQWRSDRLARISIKKSYTGQAYLVSLERFLNGFEMHFGRIPVPVKRAL